MLAFDARRFLLDVTGVRLTPLFGAVKTNGFRRKNGPFLPRRRWAVVAKSRASPESIDRRFRIAADAAERLVAAAIPVPTTIFLEDDGAAIASYAGERFVRYEQLGTFLRLHALALDELVDAPSASIMPAPNPR